MSFLLTALNSIYILITIRVVYKVYSSWRSEGLFLILGALITGMITKVYLFNPLIYVINFITYFIIIKLIFKLKFIEIINILLLYYVFVATGSLINYYYFIKYMGYSVLHLFYVPKLFITSNLTILITVVMYSVILSRLSGEKSFMQIFNLNSKTFSRIYLTATYLSIFTSCLLLFNKAFSDSKLGVFTIGAIVIFIFTSVIFIFTNYQVISKSKENVELKALIDTISVLNEKLELELVEREKIEKKLKLYATTDIMTGVYNRATGLDMIEEVKQKALVSGKNIVLCYIDINNLKIVNDTFGHNEGDMLITTVTGVLKKQISSSDIIIRLGGDEFLIVLYDRSFSEAYVAFENVEKELEILNMDKNKPYNYSISRGVIEYIPSIQEDISINDLILKADFEMYKDKKGLLVR